LDLLLPFSFLENKVLTDLRTIVEA
jgi:hypothetical protein